MSRLPPRSAPPGSEDSRVEYESHLRVDVDELPRLFGARAVEIIKERTRSGVDLHGRPLGTSLEATGQLVESVQVLEEERVSRSQRHLFVLDIGPKGARTDPKSRRARATSAKWNETVGYFVHHGTETREGKEHLPPRPWCDLSREEMRELLREAEGDALTEEPGPPRGEP